MEPKECIFCQIAQGQIRVESVWESEHAIFFRDNEPKARVHILGIPKEHCEALDQVPAEGSLVLAELLNGVQTVARSTGISKTGYRVITNCGQDAGQQVLHLHFHILGGEPLGRLLCKPSNS